MNNQSAAAKTGRKPAGHPPMQRFKPGTIKRLLSYMSEYRFRLILVGICILISAAASAASALFLQTLIDQYILFRCWGRSTRTFPACSARFSPSAACI